MSSPIMDIIVDNLANERIYTAAKQCGDYKKWHDESMHINEEIMSKLSKDKFLLLKSEELNAQCLSAELSCAYKQGLKDGVQFIMEALKNS